MVPQGPQEQGGQGGKSKKTPKSLEGLHNHQSGPFNSINVLKDKTHGGFPLQKEAYDDVTNEMCHVEGTLDCGGQPKGCYGDNCGNLDIGCIKNNNFKSVKFPEYERNFLNISQKIGATGFRGKET